MTAEPSDEIFSQFARITGALAAPSRLKLLDRLCQGEQSVEQLAAASGLSIANTSRHLRVLAEARLVTSRRVPPYAYYSLADDAVSRFWFALRDLAHERLADIERAVAGYLSGEELMTPISRSELLRRLESGDVVVLDVRPHPEFAAGHIPKAVSIPLEELAGRIAGLPAEKEVVAYCRGPYCFLAVEAVRRLRRSGIRASRLEEGFPEWREAGLPVEAGAE